MSQNFPNVEDNNIETSNQKSAELIITKFLKKGFEGLALEDLAVALMVPSFPKDFQKQTGVNWVNKYEIKALERLNHANFDIQWMTRKTNNLFDFFFANIMKGDIEKVKDFFKKSDETILYAVDDKKRSPLHLSSLQGYTSLTEFFILKGFNVNARDRLLKTPLHYACQFSNEVICNLLLKNGADIETKDSNGRNPFLYSCMGNSSQLLNLLIFTKPEIVHSLDRSGRNALHYASFNNSNRQIDIVRTLLDHKIDVNKTDEDGYTPLHLASEGGKTRVIPVLLKYGADIGLREKKTHKTAMELALNDRTREIIVVYGTVPHTINEEEQDWMNKAIKGEKVIINKAFEIKKPEENKKIIPYDDDSNSVINFLREQFFQLLKKVQMTGVQTYQHLKRPYLYTGSWMEGVTTIDELYDRIRDIKSTEAVLRVFNLLCPYDKKLPISKGDEKGIVQMYDDLWFSEEMAQNSMKPLVKIDDGKEKAMEKALEIARKTISEKDEQILKLQSKLEEESLKINPVEQLNKELDDNKLLLSKKNQQIENLNSDNLKLNRKVKELELTLEMHSKQTKTQVVDSNVTEALKSQITNLQSELSSIKNIYKSQRYKAGKLFLQVISDLKTQTSLPQEIKKIRPQDQENLEDDDAIIRLYQALKGNPPGLIPRLKESDTNGDGFLTQIEFTTFCDKLKLAPQDGQSLCRVAGFFDGKQKVGIEEFKKILEERPKLRELWEKALFKRVIRSIKDKKLTVENLFDLIDVDNNNSVSPEELRRGLEGLKIVLNPRDFANMFTIFDKDKSGSISIEEMKATLIYYEKQPDLQEDIDWNNRLKDQNLDDYDEKISSQKLKTSDKFNLTKQAIEGDNIEINDDLTLYTGDLKIQIPYAQNLLNQDKLKEIVVRIRLRGASEPDLHKNILLIDKNNWQFAIKVPIRSNLKENLADNLNIQLFSNHNFEEKCFLGEVNIDWKVCLIKMESWEINNEFILENTSFTEYKKVTGMIGIQIRYIPSTSKDFKSKLFENDSITQTKKTFLSSVIDDGTLEVSILTCILNEKKTNDPPQVLIKLNEETSKIYKHKTEDKNRFIFGELINKTMKLQSQNKIDCIYLKIFSQKPKTMGFIGGDETLLGEIYIDWEECLLYPMNFLSHKAFLFPIKSSENEKQNKFYIKIRWIPKSKEKLLKKEELQLNNYLSGTLKVLIMRAQNLPKANVDPYCKVIFDGDKRLEFKTGFKNKDPNPNWIETIILPIRFLKDCIPPLQIEVLDHNTLKDDFIGKLNINLKSCLDKPCDWSINEYFPLKDQTEKEINSTLYIQLYYIPENAVDPNIKAIDKEQKISLASEFDIVGQIKLRIIHARGLKPADGKLSDPYCIVLFPDNSQIETPSISSTLNPIWNFIKVHSVKLKSDQYKPLKLLVKDSDFLSKDDLLGFVELDWKILIEKKGLWSINDILKLTGSVDVMGKLSSLGFIYVQMKFMDSLMQDDNQYPALIEDLSQILSDKEGLYKGYLLIFLVSCKNLIAGDSDTSDPKVTFKVPGGTKLTTDKKEKTLNPVWKKQYQIQINMTKNTIQPMRAEVYDHDLVGDDFLGYTDISIEECLKKPGEWSINEIFKLDGSLEQKKKGIKNFGSIYLQCMFVYDLLTEPKKPLSLKEDQDDLTKKQLEEEESKINGLMKINIVMGKGLRIADASKGGLSDPYCTIEFPDGSKMSTQSLENTINPIWNFEYPKLISIKQKEYKPIIITVYDKDSGALDDELGFVKIDWIECVKNPGIWLVNGLFELLGDQKFGRKLGEIYVQIKFLLEKTDDKQVCPTIPELVSDYGKVLGKLMVDIISAADLKNTDFMGKTDPFCKAFLSITPDKQLKTVVIPDTMEPVWNFKGNFLFVDVRRKQCESLKFLVEIYDDDIGRSEHIGTVEIPLAPILQTQIKIPFTKDYPVILNKKQFGTIKLGLEWVPDERCESLDNLIVENYIEGQLFISVIDGHLLKKGSFICEVWLNSDFKKNKKVATKPSVSSDIAIWQSDLLIDIPKIKINEFKEDSIIVNIIEKGIFNSVLAGTSIPIKEIINEPGKWINDYFQITDKQKKLGWVSLQAQFRTKDTKILENKPIPIDYNVVLEKLKALEPKKLKGNIIVNIIGARKLSKMDITGSSDPFCTLLLSTGKTTFKTQTIKNSLNPVWNDKNKVFALELLEDDIQTIKLYAKVYDYDTLFSNDLIGEAAIDLFELFKSPGVWMNKLFALMNSQGFAEKESQVYLQIVWQPEGTELKNVELPDLMKKEKEEMEALLKKTQEEESKIPKKSGFLLINIISALNLKSLDLIGSSDPFCEISLSKGNTKKIITKTIDDNNKNPAWNLMNQTIELSMPEPEYSDLKLFIVVYDYDLNANDVLGYLTIDLFNYISQKEIWFNDFIPLMDQTGNTEKCGLLYIQFQWREDDISKISEIKIPEILKAPREIIKEPEVHREIELNIIKAKNLKVGDVFNSDSFVTIKFNKGHNGKPIQTKKITSLNPEWNHKEKIRLSLPLSQYKEIKMIAEVWDYDFPDKDDFLGKVVLELGDFFSSQEKIIDQSYVLMTEKVDKALQGELFLNLKWNDPSNASQEIKSEIKKIIVSDPEKKLEEIIKEDEIKKNNEQEDKPENIPKKVPPTEPGKISGDLKVKIIGGKDLPDMDSYSLRSKDKPCDPYCIFKLYKGSPKTITTKTIENNNNPVWNHEDILPLKLPIIDLKDLKAIIEVMDDDFGSNESVGVFEINLGSIIEKQQNNVRNWYQIVDKKGKNKGNAMIEIELDWKQN